MPGHVDILEQRESIRKPFVASLALHGAVFTAIALSTSLGERGRVLWGTPRALGGGSSVGITPVRQIPLPFRAGASNPLANDTESRVPRPPKPELERQAKPAPPEAIALRGRKKPAAESPAARRRQTFASREPQRPNQLYSGAGQALSSPMFGAQTGTGGVGMGPGGAFGSRFGWYRDLLEQRVAQKWRTDEVDPRLQTAPPVIVAFDLLRNGSIRDTRVLQSSGNLALDRSAQRAIYEASPFPSLPPEYDREAARIEFWFQLKR
jgi:TonB family protein